MPTLIDKHLAYIDNATISAQKRQEKLWKQVNRRRGKGGILPLNDEILDEYIAAARMTASLMIDIEMVRDEYFAEKGIKRKPGIKKADIPPMPHATADEAPRRRGGARKKATRRAKTTGRRKTAARRKKTATRR